MRFLSDSYNFYPRPPRGGRPDLAPLAMRNSVFLSTPSARRATEGFVGKIQTRFYFYPRPPRGGRLNGNNPRSNTRAFLSTPSARRATGQHRQRLHVQHISIHALREEGDVRTTSIVRCSLIFLSTPSARRATRFSRQAVMFGSNFYPRPPRGGRQQKQRQNLYFQTNYTTFCTNLEEP